MADADHRPDPEKELSENARQERTANTMRSLAAFSASGVLVTGIDFGLRLLRNILFTRLLGPEFRGVLGLVNTVPTLCVSLGSLGFGLGTTFLATKKQEDIRRLLANALLYALIQGVLLVLLAVIAFSFKDDLLNVEVQAGPAKFFIILGIPVLLLQKLGLDLLTAIKRIHTTNALNVLFALLPIVLFLAFLPFIDDVFINAALSWLLGIFTVSLLSYAIVIRDARGVGRPSMDLARRAMSFGFRGYLSQMANAIVRRVDVIFLAHFHTVEVVGFYAVAVSIAEMVLAIPGAVALPYLPLRMESQNDESRAMFAMTMKYLFILLVGLCAGTALFAWPALYILFGKEFLPAHMPLLFLIPGIFFLSFYQVVKIELYSHERPTLVAVVSIAAMVVNIVLNFVLIPPLGANGAAISSSLSYGVSTLVLLCINLNMLELSFRDILVFRKEDREFTRRQLTELVARLRNRGGK